MTTPTPVASATPACVLKYAPQCRVFEDTVPHFYLDPRGLVTIGVGNMVPDAAAALRLPLRVQSSGDLAGESAVRADFVRVAAMAPGKVPAFYAEYESLVLSDADINALLMSRLVDFYTRLNTDFAGFATFPQSAQVGLLDMIYNAGDGTLMKRYPKFDAAVRAGDWISAAHECKRDPTVKAFDARNKWTVLQFVGASKVVAAKGAV
jgi:GH24 family phage-related lysozyme (muramidase)